MEAMQAIGNGMGMGKSRNNTSSCLYSLKSTFGSRQTG